MQKKTAQVEIKKINPLKKNKIAIYLIAYLYNAAYNIFLKQRITSVAEAKSHANKIKSKISHKPISHGFFLLFFLLKRKKTYQKFFQLLSVFLTTSSNNFTLPKEKTLKEPLSAIFQKSHVRSLNRRKKVGFLYISSTYNNTFLTLTNKNKKVITAMSCGSAGFKKAQRGTAFSVKNTIIKMCQKLEKLKYGYIYVIYRGASYNKPKVQKIMSKYKFQIVLYKDITVFPHNGCRARKKKRK